MNKSSKNTEMIVLKEIDYKDSSKIITSFTSEMGKISILAQGAKRPKSSLIACTQLFAHSSVNVRKGKSFFYIDFDRMISSNFKLRSNYDSIAQASLICEIIDKSFIENEPNKIIFELFAKTLNFLVVNPPRTISIAFLLKYMSYLGYRPEFREMDIGFFSIEDSFIMEYDDPSKTTYKLNRKMIEYLNLLLYTALDELKYSLDKSDERYLQNMILEFVKYHLEIENLNSANFI